MTLTERSVSLTKSQIAKIRKSLEDPEQPLRLRFSHAALTDGSGVHKLYLGVMNSKKVEKRLSEGKGAMIELTKEEREYNLKHGGFLGALLSNPIVSALAGPVLGAVASKAIDMFTGGPAKKSAETSSDLPTIRRPRKIVAVEDDDDEGDDDDATEAAAGPIARAGKTTKKGGILYAAGDVEGRGTVKGPKKIPPPGQLLFTT